MTSAANTGSTDPPLPMSEPLPHPHTDGMSRRAFVHDLAHTIAAVRVDHPTRVAIDGIDAAGKTMLADELALVLRNWQRPVIRASVDGFHNPRSIRYRMGRSSPEGYFEDAFDLRALCSLLLDPLGPGGSRSYVDSVFDWREDGPTPRVVRTAAPDAILLLDGVFLHRPELHPYWDLGIFLDISFCNSLERGLRRALFEDPQTNARALLEQYNLRYIPGQRLYLTSCSPANRASIVVDNNDIAHPRISKRPG